MRASSVQSSTTAPGVSSVPSVVGVASALSLSERLERRRQEKMGVQSDHPVAAEKAAGKMVTFDDSAAGQLHEPCRKTGGVRDEPPQSLVAMVAARRAVRLGLTQQQVKQEEQGAIQHEGMLSSGNCALRTPSAAVSRARMQITTIGESSRASPTVGPASVIAESEAPASRPSSMLAANPVQQTAPKLEPVAATTDAPVKGQQGPPPEGPALLRAIQQVAARTLAAGIKAPSPALESEAQAQVAAWRLFQVIAPEVVRRGLGFSRVSTNLDPESRAKYVVESLIMPIGGKGGAGSDKARLFLDEYQAALDAAGDTAPMFPLKTVEVQAMVAKFVDADKVTRLSGVKKACTVLRTVGCDVGADLESLVFPATAKPGRKGPGRTCPPPMWVMLDEGWALHAPREINGAAACPHGDYVSNSVLRRRLGDRGAQYAKSRWAKKDEVCFRVKGLDPSKYGVLIGSEDKGRRLDSVHVVPLESLVRPGPCPWAAIFIASRAALGYMHVDFETDMRHPEHIDPKLAAVISSPCVNVTDTSNPSGYKFCPTRKALLAETEARSMSSGLSIDDMKTWGLTGTHPDRHIAPEVTARAGWPQKAADCIGDWATPKDGTQRDKSLSTHIPTSSARKGYQPNASLKDQLNARIRYARLLQTAFALYEAKQAVTWETTWQDLLPVPPPPELAPFYGAQTDDLCPEVDPSAAFTGVTFGPETKKARVPRTKPVAPPAGKRQRKK